MARLILKESLFMSSQKPEKMKNSIFNFNRVLAALKTSVSTPVKEKRDLSGIIKDFEFVYELSWKTLKELLLFEGKSSTGPKDVFRQAYSLGYLDDETIWLNIIEARNQTVHTYDEKKAEAMVKGIRDSYMAVFDNLSTLFKTVDD